MAASKKKPPRKGRKVIFVAYVTRKDGTIDYARDHGLRAWAIEVRD